MTRYGLATIFERVKDGYEFDTANPPLHLTHIDVLEIGLEPDSFIYELTEHLSKEPPFMVTPTTDTFFGSNKDIPVTLVEHNPDLRAFHGRLLAFLLSHDAVFDNPQFLGEHYAPHISIYGPRRANAGIPITINSVSIGHKRTDIPNPPGRIISTVPLA